MVIKTERLILRPWQESDAESLYEYAKNPLIGPAAGWPVHTSVENSLQIIRDVLSADETYAVMLKGDDKAIGSVGLLIGDKSNLNINSDEAEIGYWIGEPFWGQGLIPEAVRELIRYAFENLNMTTLWCGYFDGNEKSKRAGEKCGFKFHHTEYGKEWLLINAVKTQHVTCLTKEEWRTMQNEIIKVMELTGATENQIALHDDGYWSRAYVVNGGEFVVKFPKYDDVSYESEAKFLNLISSMVLPVITQKVKWLAEDNRSIAIFGVKGTPLSKIEITTPQKQIIGKQIGAFLKQLHSLKSDFGGQSLDEELLEYKKLYGECADFYAKHFSKEEQRTLDYLMHTYLPAARKDLGEKPVFCHADIWEPNLLLDDDGTVGVIDCANAGYYDEAADFMVEDEMLRGFILDAYGADEALRKKVDLKYDMSVIAGPHFGVTLWGEDYVVKKWVPIIRKTILKYSQDTTTPPPAQTP